MTNVFSAFWNPIVSKEYRSRMRTWRSPLAMTVYILLIGGLGWAIFAAMAYSARSSYGGGQAANYGQGLFIYLLIFQMVLLTFITPALTAGAISSEREHQTIDLLFVTRIPPFSILWGKLLASMSFVLLLLLLSVPIFSLVFLFGGIELDQVLIAFLITAVAALTLGTIGIACSTAFRRTLPATVAAYGAAFALLAGSLLYGLLFPTDSDPQSTSAAAPPAITYLSPIIPLITVATSGPVGGFGVRNQGGVSGGSGMACSGGPYGGPQTCYPIGANGQPLGKGSVSGPHTDQLQASGTRIPSGLFSGWQYWQATIFMQLGLGLCALLISAFLLPPVRRFPRVRSPRAA